LTPPDITDEERILSEITGNTLLVYWHLLKKGRDSCGVREVQRTLGFSSPSSASYQLEKLRQLGLVSKDRSGDYQICSVLKAGVISAFIFFGGHAFPKHLLYASATSMMILLFVTVFSNALSPIVMIALLPGVLAAAIFWYETSKVWRRRPSRRWAVR
jgi:DNA-binding transcriptional ArsR family regulator